jgi:PAS domain S-box-containing protein
MMRDITDRKNTERLLREKGNLLTTIMENSPAVVFLKDCDGRYLYANPQFSSTFGLSLEQIIGMTDFDLFSKDQASVFHANDHVVIDNRAAMQFEESQSGKMNPIRALFIDFHSLTRMERFMRPAGLARILRTESVAKKLYGKAKSASEIWRIQPP